MIKVGLLGGVFDPVHIGHLHIADGVARTLKLDRIFLIPVGEPPLKRQSPVASGKHRLEMLRLAIRNNSLMSILDLELRRQGKSYTIDTLQALQAMHADWILYFIVGGDNYSEIQSWRDPEMIFRTANVVMVNRPGSAWKNTSINLPGEIIKVTLPGLDISSSQIREYITNGISCRYLLPPGVLEYIVENKLYQ